MWKLQPSQPPHRRRSQSRPALAGPLLRLRSDDQLVALFRAGHDEAFRVIHDRYRPRLFAYARQMLSGSRADAEDVLQDVFLRAYDALRAERPRDLAAGLALPRRAQPLHRPDAPAAALRRPTTSTSSPRRRPPTRRPRPSGARTCAG